MRKIENSSKNCLQLDYGDAVQIAKITGFSHQYVRMVICGVRSNDMIIEVAKKLIQSRKDLKQSIQNSKTKKTLTN